MATVPASFIALAIHFLVHGFFLEGARWDPSGLGLLPGEVGTIVEDSQVHCADAGSVPLPGQPRERPVAGCERA